MSRSEIEAFVYDFRKAIEPCWGPDTGSYSPDLFPEGYEVPPSGGQCVGTSGCLLHELRDAFPGDRFRLSVGALYLGQVAVLTHHTFVTHHPVLGRSPTIADVTPDQAPGVSDEVVYGDLLDLASRGLMYCIFTSYEVVPAKICEDVPPGITPVYQRTALLRQRMSGWRAARPSDN